MLGAPVVAGPRGERARRHRRLGSVRSRRERRGVGLRQLCALSIGELDGVQRHRDRDAPLPGRARRELRVTRRRSCAPPLAPRATPRSDTRTWASDARGRNEVARRRADRGDARHRLRLQLPHGGRPLPERPLPADLFRRQLLHRGVHRRRRELRPVERELHVHGRRADVRRPVQLRGVLWRDVRWFAFHLHGRRLLRGLWSALRELLLHRHGRDLPRCGRGGLRGPLWIAGAIVRRRAHVRVAGLLRERLHPWRDVLDGSWRHGAQPVPSVGYVLR